MNINQMYPSKYIKSDDLQGQRLKLQIMSVTIEEVGDGEHKPVMRFIGKEKGMVLNKTNALALAVAFGDDTISWQGREIELLAMPVMFQGKQVMGLHTLPIGLSTAAASPPLSNDALTQQQFQQPGPHDADAQLVQPQPTTQREIREQSVESLAADIEAAEKAAGIDF